MIIYLIREKRGTLNTFHEGGVQIEKFSAAFLHWSILIQYSISIGCITILLVCLAEISIRSFARQMTGFTVVIAVAISVSCSRKFHDS